MSRKIYLYLDDERLFAPDKTEWDSFILARTYTQAIRVIRNFCKKTPTDLLLIDLDHDLGREKTGYDVCKYIVENQIKNVKYRIHTMNPVGRDNMDQLMSHYGYERF